MIINGLTFSQLWDTMINNEDNQMNKIIMTLMGATMLTSVANAEISKKDMDHAIMNGNSAVCNTLDKGVAFNKRTLSAFDKCWLNVHKADEKSGISGNLFWVKVGNDFVSMPTKDLYQSGSKAKAKEMVKERIVTQVITNTVTEYTNILTEDQRTGLDLLAEYAVGTGVDQTTSEWLTSRNATIEYLGENIKAHIAFDNATTISEKITILGAYVTTLDNFIAGLPTRADILREAKLLIDQGVDATARRIAAEKTLYNLGLTQFTNYNPTRPEGRNVGNTMNASGNNGNNVGATYSGGGRRHVMVDGVEVTDKAHRYANYFERVNDLLEQVYDIAYDKGYLEGFEDGYNQGYSEGYNEGYADGYADGFSDGVDSVQ